MVDVQSGLLGATILPTSRAFVPPRVELENGYLLWWRYDADSANPHGLETSSRGMLDAFVRVKTPEDVLRFARRYGYLALCEHGLPATHNWTGEKAGCYPLGWHQRVCREPVERWVHYASEARALVSIAAELQQGKEGQEESWQALLDRYREDDPRLELARNCRATAEGRRSLLSSLVNEWLARANARLSLTWNAAKSRWDLMMRGTTFTILATQLMFAIGGAHRLAICDACGQPYLREGRAPQSGRLNFCPRCRGTRKANTLRQRRYRAKKRAQQRTREDTDG